MFGRPLISSQLRCVIGRQAMLTPHRIFDCNALWSLWPPMKLTTNRIPSVRGSSSSNKSENVVPASPAAKQDVPPKQNDVQTGKTMKTSGNLGEWIPWLVSVVNGAQNVDFQVTKRGGTIRGQADY